MHNTQVPKFLPPCKLKKNETQITFSNMESLIFHGGLFTVGGIFCGGYFLGVFSTRGIFRGLFSTGGIFRGGLFFGGYFPRGGIFLGGYFLRGCIFQGVNA